MSENRIQGKDNAAPRERRNSRHGFWFGIFVGGLVGTLAGAALVSTAKVSAASMGVARAFQGRFSARFAADPERAREHLEFATDWVLSRVNATDEQKTEAKQIADRTLDAVLPLAEQHRSNREALAAELAKTEIDPAAIEQIRQSELGLVDDFSKELTSALTEIAQTLTPEQRNELLEHARKIHRRDSR